MYITVNRLNQVFAAKNIRRPIVRCFATLEEAETAAQFEWDMLPVRDQYQRVIEVRHVEDADWQKDARYYDNAQLILQLNEPHQSDPFYRDAGEYRFIVVSEKDKINECEDFDSLSSANEYAAKIYTGEFDVHIDLVFLSDLNDTAIDPEDGFINWADYNIVSEYEEDDAFSSTVQTMTIKEICDCYCITQTELARRFDIPLRTVQEWHGGRRTPPDYLNKMIIELLEQER